MNLLTAMKVTKIVGKGGLSAAFSLLDRTTKEDLKALCVGIYAKESFKKNVEKLIEDCRYELESISILIKKYAPKKTKELEKRKPKKERTLSDYDFLREYLYRLVKIGFDPKDYDLEDCFYLLRDNEKDMLLSNFNRLAGKFNEADNSVIAVYLDNWDYDDLETNRKRYDFYIKKARTPKRNK